VKLVRLSCCTYRYIQGEEGIDKRAEQGRMMAGCGDARGSRRRRRRRWKRREIQKKKIKSQSGRWTPRSVFGNYRRVLVCVEADTADTTTKVYMTD